MKKYEPQESSEIVSMVLIASFGIRNATPPVDRPPYLTGIGRFSEQRDLLALEGASTKLVSGGRVA